MNAKGACRWWGPALGVLLASVSGPHPAASQALHPAPSQAAAEVHLSGVVVEARTSDPVRMAEVILEAGEDPAAHEGPPAPSGHRRSAWTDESGEYRFDRVPPGRYRLTIRRLGYHEAVLWLEMPAPGTVRRSVGLEVDPVRLSPVNPVAGPLVRTWPIEGRAAQGPRAGVRSAFGAGGGRPTLDSRALDPEDVTRLSAMGEPDVFRSLQRLPGMSARGDFSAELWTRGAPWGLTRVLLDGIPVYDPLHVGGNTSALAVEGLDAVLVLPGVRTATFAEGAAGTVNLVTRPARAGPSGSVAVSPMAARAHLEDRWAGDRVGLALTARRSWWDLVDPPRIFTGGRSSGGIDYHFTDVSTRFDARLAGGMVLEAGGFREKDRLDGEVFDLVVESEGEWGNEVGWVALGRAWDAVRVRALVGRSTHASRTRAKPGAFFLTHPGAPILDRMNLDLARTVLRLEAGGLVESDAKGRIGTATVEWAAGLDRSRETLSQYGIRAADLDAPGLSDPAVAGWHRAWGQVEAHAGPVSLSTGLAWDLPGDGDPQGMGPLPNVRLRLHPTARLVLEGARGRSIQTAYPFADAGRTIGPALGAGKVWNLVGRDVPPLTSDIATLGAELALDEGFGVSGTLWRRDVAGVALNGVQVVREGRTFWAAPEDLPGKERGRGFEVSVWKRVGGLLGEVSYSRARAWFIAPEGDVWSSPAERRQSLNAVLEGRLRPGLRAGAVFREETGWPYVLGPWSCPEHVECDIEPGDPLRPMEHIFLRAPSFQALDLRADMERRGERVGWGATLSVLNVLGRDNASAFRPDGCGGAGLISPVCGQAVGVGRLAPGLGGPAPAISLRVFF